MTTTAEPLLLDKEQQKALQSFQEGHSIALIGGAGCGKSFVLNRLIEEAEKIYGKFPRVAACALTNKAASAMKGTTIHSLFGAKPSWEFSKQYLWEGVKRKPKLRERIRQIRVLIIDEISLLRSNEIDAIDFVFRELAETEWHASLTFGGRIVIVAGDPFQLEPYEEEGNVQKEARCTSFQSRTWYLTFGPHGDGVVIVLKRNHRQADDNRFFKILNRIRTGERTLEDLEVLNNTSGNSRTPPGTYTRLFTTNEQVAQINRKVLSQLPGELIPVVARDSYFLQRNQALEARLGSVAPKEVVLKVGARVILTRKFGKVLPGTQCVIRNFRSSKKNQFNLTTSWILSCPVQISAGKVHQIARTQILQWVSRDSTSMAMIVESLRVVSKFLSFRLTL